MKTIIDKWETTEKNIDSDHPELTGGVNYGYYLDVLFKSKDRGVGISLVWNFRTLASREIDRMIINKLISNENY